MTNGGTSVAGGAAKATSVWTVVGIVLPIIATVVAAAVVLNRSIGQVEGQVKGINDRFDDFNDRLATLDDITRRFEPQVSRLEGQVAAFTPNVTRFNEGVGRFDQALASVSELRAEHQRIMDELANLREAHRQLQAPVDRTVRYVAPEGGEPVPAGFYQDITARLRRIEARIDGLIEGGRAER